MIRYVLCDVEGTTTAISFVHDTLFPYARKHLRTFVREHREEAHIESILADVKATLAEEGTQINVSDGDAIDALIAWIDADRKHPALKTLQGYIWKDGYTSGGFQGHVYEDVVPTMECWRRKGIMLGIYSSGSVAAQKLLFGYSIYGDLNGYFAHNFDTAVGHKRETASYQQIAKTIGFTAEEILFLSDVEAELVAAQAAGMRVTQLVRPGTEPSEKFPIAKDFTEISI